MAFWAGRIRRARQKCPLQTAPKKGLPLQSWKWNGPFQADKLLGQVWISSDRILNTCLRLMLYGSQRLYSLSRKPVEMFVHEHTFLRPFSICLSFFRGPTKTCGFPFEGAYPSDGTPWGWLILELLLVLYVVLMENQRENRNFGGGGGGHTQNFAAVNIHCALRYWSLASLKFY